jgi:pre-mRNA-splicing factor CWC22
VRAEKPAGPAGGAYIPPFKLAQMMREVDDKASPAYQRLTWDALRKSINGLVNKVNAANIKHLLPELFGEARPPARARARRALPVCLVGRAAPSAGGR